MALHPPMRLTPTENPLETDAISVHWSGREQVALSYSQGRIGKTGKFRTTSGQLHMPPSQARELARRLNEIADLIENRVKA